MNEITEQVLSREQIAIMRHTVRGAAGGYYCGGGPDMDRLVSLGLMEYAGRKSFVPDPYFTITREGRRTLSNLDKAKPA